MADVRVRNADNVVLEAGLDGTLVAGAGETIFTEPATFIPTWADVTWQRTGVSTYIIIDQDTGPLNDADSPEAQGTAVVVTANDTTPGTLLDKIVSSDSSVTVAEVNDGGDEDISLVVNEANVDHDALQNFVANEHIDHSGVSVTAGGDDGLVAANDDLTSNIGLQVDITGTTALGAAPDGADEILIQDVSGAVKRKITVTELLQSVSATDTIAFNGGIRDVDAGESVGAAWGDRRAIAGVTQRLAGNIVGFTATSDRALTAGSIEVQVTINGVAQNGVGQTLTLSTQSGFLDLSGAPIAVAQGDVINMVAIGGATLAPNNHDLTVAVEVSR